MKLFQIYQNVPILNHELWLICGFPQCCKMAKTTQRSQNYLVGQSMFFVLLLVCLFKLCSLRLSSLSSSTTWFHCVAARRPRSMIPGSRIAAAYTAPSGDDGSNAKAKIHIFWDVTTTRNLTFNPLVSPQSKNIQRASCTGKVPPPPLIQLNIVIGSGQSNGNGESRRVVCIVLYNRWCAM